MKENGMGGAHSTNGNQENCLQKVVRKHEYSSPLTKHKRRQRDNIKVYFKEIYFGIVE
jgi:hypothetical protein